MKNKYLVKMLIGLFVIGAIPKVSEKRIKKAIIHNTQSTMPSNIAPIQSFSDICTELDLILTHKLQIG